MTNKDEALKMAIEQIKHLIEIYIPSPEWSGTAVQEECYETINACKEALEQPAQRNFCERCGKRASKDQYHIHTCTPPQALKEKNHVS
jgi:hypothetical protein